MGEGETIVQLCLLQTGSAVPTEIEIRYPHGDGTPGVFACIDAAACDARDAANNPDEDS